MSPEDTGQDAKVDGGRGGTWSVLGIMRAMRDAKPGIGQISIGGQRTKSDISNPHPKKKKKCPEGTLFLCLWLFQLTKAEHTKILDMSFQVFLSSPLPICQGCHDPKPETRGLS